MLKIWPWIKKYKFWVIWTLFTILVWGPISLFITSMLGNSTRGFAFLLAAPLAFVGLYLASKRTKALEEQNETDSKRLLTETFAKSIELMGHNEVAVRQGAIYALGKIAKTNPDELTVIVNSLCAFIRHTQSNSIPKIGRRVIEKDTLNMDIEAAIKTIVELSSNFKSEDDNDIKKYDLSNIRLCYADFSNAKLVNFNLSDSTFDNCIFDKVDFSNSNLIASKFPSSNFKNAKFDAKTELEQTDFSNAIGLTATMLEETLEKAVKKLELRVEDEQTKQENNNYITLPPYVYTKIKGEENK